jgi:hypothetical protein
VFEKRDSEVGVQRRQACRPAIEQRTRFALVINLKSAQKLGPTIPPSMRARAEVIE